MIPHRREFRVEYRYTQRSGEYDITVTDEMLMAADSTNQIARLFDLWIAEHGKPETTYTLVWAVAERMVYVLPEGHEAHNGTAADNLS